MFGHLKLRAINPARNVNRVYEIHVGQGLFNTITVILAYGRYGKGFHQRLYSFDNTLQANAFIHKTLQKRLNAHKRIGCGYEVVWGDFTLLRV